MKNHRIIDSCLQGSSGNTFPGGEKNILQGKNKKQESGKQVWSMRKQSGIDGVGRTGLRGAAWLAAMGLSLFLLTGCGQDGESTGNPVPGSAGSISGAEGGFSDDADSRADSSGQVLGETNVGNGVGSGITARETELEAETRRTTARETELEAETRRTTARKTKLRARVRRTTAQKTK